MGLTGYYANNLNRDLSEGGLRGAAAGHNEGDMKMAQYDEYAVHQDEIV